MKSFVLFAILGLLPETTFADNLPQYNVSDHCEHIATVTGTRSEVIFDGCMNMEQSAYDVLKMTWSDLPAQMQAQCERIATVSGSGSYSLLKGCIDMEQNSAQRNKTRQFRY